jgi:hypothetical protein
LAIGAAAAVLLLAVLIAWWLAPIGVSRDVGYLAAVFTPDGASVITVKREARALVTGLGREFFTPPATVRMQRDDFELVSIGVADQHATVLETFPPSPLAGSRIRAYHGAIFGVAHAHLRWADATHLEYEIAVTRHDSPLARTFVTRRVWNPATGTYATTGPWQETSTGMAGDEPGQLHDDLEAIVVPGDELMPCGIALLRRDRSSSMLVQTDTCRRKYRGGISTAVLTPLIRRADIERSEKIRTTYEELVARNRTSGQTDGQARLQANREMQRLGFYPKTTMLVAERADCGTPSPLFSIADAEFSYGLFPDIESAIQKPGTEVDKSIGDYITHRDYTTSRSINEYIKSGNSTVYVRARGTCWRLSIRRP